MSKQEEMNMVRSIANMSVVYEDIASSKTLDFIEYSRKKQPKHKQKRALSIIEAKRKLIEAHLTKTVEDRKFFADVVDDFEDAIHEEYTTLKYNVANVVGKAKGIDHDWVARGTVLFLLLTIISLGYEKANKQLENLQHWRGKKLTSNVDDLLKAVRVFMDMLVANCDRKIGIDDDPVVADCIYLLVKKLGDKDLINEIVIKADGERKE